MFRNVETIFIYIFYIYTVYRHWHIYYHAFLVTIPRHLFTMIALWTLVLTLAEPSTPRKSWGRGEYRPGTPEGDSQATGFISVPFVYLKAYTH